jgi:hypothetical protein
VVLDKQYSDGGIKGTRERADSIHCPLLTLHLSPSFRFHMSAPKTTKVWKLKNAPVKEVDDRTFELSVEDLPDVSEGEVMIKTLYLSNGQTPVLMLPRPEGLTLINRPSSAADDPEGHYRRAHVCSPCQGRTDNGEFDELFATVAVLMRL